MRTLTMQGIAPDPNWQRRAHVRPRIEPELVFQLTRKLERSSAMPTFAGGLSHPRGLGISTRGLGISTRRSIPGEGRPTTRVLDKLPVGEPIAVRTSWRRIFVRVGGSLALAAALLGSGFVLRDSTARRQALTWATLGHADVVFGAVH